MQIINQLYTLCPCFWMAISDTLEIARYLRSLRWPHFVLLAWSTMNIGSVRDVSELPLKYRPTLAVLDTVSPLSNSILNILQNIRIYTWNPPRQHLSQSFQSYSPWRTSQRPIANTLSKSSIGTVSSRRGTDTNFFDFCSKMATEYKDRFADSIKTLSEQTLKHRLWLSDQWLDTESGKDKDIKMLEYACGPGLISMVSGSPMY